MPFQGVSVKEKKKFDVVKHVKRLSRVVTKAPQGQVVPSRKKDLLKKIEEKEVRNPDRG